MELFLLFLAATLLTVTGAEISYYDGPENTLSVVGSNATLKCLSPFKNCRRTDWMKRDEIDRFSDSGSTYGENWTVISAFGNRYSVDNSSGCDLVIENVQLTDAGVFRCRVFGSEWVFEGCAYLTILKTRPACTIATYPNGDMMHLMCKVTYNGAKTASMVWKGVKNAPGAVENGTTISLAYVVPASAPEVPAFTCITSFKVKTEDDAGRKIYRLASNVPVTTCETPAIKILSEKLTSVTMKYIGIGVGFGFVIAMLLACIVFAVSVKLRHLEFSAQPANECFDGVEQHTNRELSTMDPWYPFVVEQEPAYASLGERGDANEYASLEQI